MTETERCSVPKAFSELRKPRGGVVTGRVLAATVMPGPRSAGRGCPTA